MDDLVPPVTPGPVAFLPIRAAATRPLRRTVLRPHQDEDAVVYAGDDDPVALHIGAMRGDGLVGVSSIAPDPTAAGAWRVRGMAVRPDARGRGIGAGMLACLIAHADAAGADLVWCNARVAAVRLYERAGFVAIGGVFDIPDIGPHVRMERRAGG